MEAVISQEDLKTYIAAREGYILIDVRNKDELIHGKIPTAIHIPLPEIQEAFQLDSERFKEKYGFEKMKHEDNLIFYCRTGARSHTATQMALALGYRARNYKGSIWEWSATDHDVQRYGPAPLGLFSIR